MPASMLGFVAVSEVTDSLSVSLRLLFFIIDLCMPVVDFFPFKQCNEVPLVNFSKN